MPMNNETFAEEFLISPTSSSNLDASLLNRNQHQTTNNINNNNSAAIGSNALTKYEGHKWEEVFDFEKILRQINNAEKKFLRRNCPSATCKNNADQQPINLNSPPRSPSLKCSRQTNQVQRLNGDDMHYYGLAPLQEALEVVICNYCTGTYTKKGLNNHMLLHHPNVWSNTPSKLPSPPDFNHLSNSVLGVHANSLDVACHNDNAIVSGGTPSETIPPSPLELASTLSTNSTSSTNSNSTVYSTPSGRQKGTSKSRSASNSGTGRSRNRTKNQKEKDKDKEKDNAVLSSTPTTPLPTKPSASPSQKGSKNYSRRNNSAKSAASTSSATTLPVPTVATSLASALANTLAKENASSSTTKDTTGVPPILVHSSSSNSSCSLPSTPKMIATPPNESLLSAATNDSSTPFSPGIINQPSTNLEIKVENFVKTKTFSSSTSSSSGSSTSSYSKKKSKSPTTNTTVATASELGDTTMSALGKELKDTHEKSNQGSVTVATPAVSTKTTSSTPSSRGSKNSKKKSQQQQQQQVSLAAAITQPTPNLPTIPSVPNILPTAEATQTLATVPISRQLHKEPAQLTNPYQSEINEIDQAVSAISNSLMASSAAVAANQSNSLILGTCDSSALQQQQQQQQQHIATANQQNTQLPATTSNLQNQLQQTQILPNVEDNLSQNASDDNSILTFDDMTFIDEILNNANTEINFDENALDQAAQQNFEQQPAIKRMRFEEAPMAPAMVPMQQAQPQQTQPQQVQIQQQQQQELAQQQIQLQQQIPHQLLTNVVTGDFSLYPQPNAQLQTPTPQAQQQQQQQQQQFVQYNPTALEDIKLYNNGTSLGQVPQIDASQYQAEINKVLQQQQQLATIDAMQLQQLLYQQQDINNTYINNELDAAAANALHHQQQQQQQQQYQFCSEDDKTKIHLDAGNVGLGVNVPVDDKLLAFAAQQQPQQQTVTDSLYGQAYTNVAGQPGQSMAASQFNVFNVPSLTDDNNATTATVSNGEVVLPNLVTAGDLTQNPAQQFVLPTGNGEEQLIYEITANNQVSVMSQQRQQQVIAELLSQAVYGNADQIPNNILPQIEEINVAPQLTQPPSATTNHSNNNLSEESFDDLEFTKIETYKSSSSSSNNSSNSSSSSSNSNSNNNSNSSTTSISINASVAQTQDKNINAGISAIQSAKNVDDFYINVHSYAGIPRPIAMNSFGIVKLPQCVSTAFRKSILVNRKGYTNPLTSNSTNNTNGGVLTTNLNRFTGNGNGNSNSSTNTNANANSNGNGNGSNSTTNAGTSSATNTNTTSSIIKTVNEYTIGNITITNSSTPIQPQQQQQQNQNPKAEAGSNTTTDGNQLTNASATTTSMPTTQRGRQKGTASTPSGILTTAATNKARPGGTTPSSTNKTINITHFGAGSSIAGEKPKIIKRSLIGKQENTTKVNIGFFTPKKISDLLNGKIKMSSNIANITNNANNNSNNNNNNTGIHHSVNISNLNNSILDHQSSSSSASSSFHLNLHSQLQQQQPQQQQQSSSDIHNTPDAKILQPQEVMTEQQQRLNRVQNFYEKRRKLLNLTNNATSKNNNYNNSSNNTNSNYMKANANNLYANAANIIGSGNGISGGVGSNILNKSNINNLGSIGGGGQLGTSISNSSLSSSSSNHSSLSNNSSNSKDSQIIPTKNLTKPPQQQQQQQQQILKTQLMRNLSDYNFPTTIAQCKVTSSSNTNANGNTNSSDLMRVFV